MTVTWEDETRTRSDDVVFMEVVIGQLRETAHQYKEHTWSKATFVILNNNGFVGQPLNGSGLFNPGDTVNPTLLKFWCDWNDAHGYGIFHSWRWENNGFVMVSLCYIPFPSLTSLSRMRRSHTLHFRRRFGWRHMQGAIPGGSPYRSRTICQWTCSYLGNRSMRERPSAAGYALFYSHSIMCSDPTYFLAHCCCERIQSAFHDGVSMFSHFTRQGPRRHREHMFVFPQHFVWFKRANQG